MSTQKAETYAVAGDAREGASLLDSIITQSKVAKSEVERDRTRDLIGELVSQVSDGTLSISKDLAATLDARVAEIDKIISEQLSLVMHAPEFQRLEASWRGLAYLCSQTETSTTLKIKVLNSPKQDLVRDFKAATDFDQSALFKKIYEEEFGTFGGAPFGMLIGDYEISRAPEDMYFAEQMSHVGAAAHAPFIAAASPELFGWEGFTELGRPRDIAKVFDTVEYAKWKSLRESEDGRYLALTLPHFLGRMPYGGPDGTTVEAFNFIEDVDGTDHKKYLWVNAAYAFGARVTNAFAQYGWTAAIRGVEGGGLVEDLPTHTFRTDQGDIALKCPTEIAITDRREKELSDLGFMPLVHCKNTDYAAFFGAQSIQKPKKYTTDSATANANLSAQLQYVFTTCRIAHYLKAMMRDKIGSFASRDGVQHYLNEWLTQYVLLDDMASQEAKARFPLREASVEVVDVPGKPGAYKAVAFLRPHFQLDELTVSLRLVAELPQAARG